MNEDVFFIYIQKGINEGWRIRQKKEEEKKTYLVSLTKKRLWCEKSNGKEQEIKEGFI